MASQSKITITLPDEQLEQVRSLVHAGQAASVSAFVRHAVTVALEDAAEFRQMLAEALDRTGGPMTASERAWADCVLGIRPRKRSPRKKRVA